MTGPRRDRTGAPAPARNETLGRIATVQHLHPLAGLTRVDRCLLIDGREYHFEFHEGDSDRVIDLLRRYGLTNVQRVRELIQEANQVAIIGLIWVGLQRHHADEFKTFSTVSMLVDRAGGWLPLAAQLLPHQVTHADQVIQ